jgi:hypothetical protein
MKNISARNKGLITGAVMIAMSVGIYSAKNGFDNGLQYIVYTTYVAGILWTLFTFKKETRGEAGFKQYFAEGFKCFIVVTLLMVLFTLAFILMHPELKEQMATMMRADYANAKNLTPVDVENKIDAAKKFFLPGFLMGAMLSYLAIGALISAIGAGFLSVKKANI